MEEALLLPADYDEPPPPVIGKLTNHSIELFWHPPDDGEQTRYCLQQQKLGQDSDFFIVYESESVSDNRYFVDGLEPGTAYKYRIKATTDEGRVSWSKPVTATTTYRMRSSDHLHRAVLKGDCGTIESILTESPRYLNIPDKNGYSPLMSAAKTNQKRVIELLLALHADVEFTTATGRTSMMEACYHGNGECAWLLRQAGASWLTRDHSGMSALHWAVDGGQTKTVELLLQDRVPVDDVGTNTVKQWTPLLRNAALAGSPAVAGVLIQHGADVNRRDVDGNTPLMLATINRNKDLVALLLSSGADPRIRSKYGKTALHFAESLEKDSIATLIQNYSNATSSKESSKKGKR